MARYQCNLPHDLLEKAVQELNEPRDNKDRLNAIDVLKNGFDTTKFGNLISSDDKFLLRFLRAKKFDQEKALIVLQNYHKVRKEMTEVFSMVEDPKSLKDLMECGIMYFLNGKSKTGESVLVYRPALLTRQFSIYKVMAYGVLCVEEMLKDEEFQICGIITVDDLAAFGLKSLSNVSLSAGKMFNQIWQDAMPVRVRNIYIFNEGKVFDIMFYFFKFFMKEKMKKRIKLHGNNYAALHEEVDPSILPPCLNGTGASMDDGCREWVTRIQQEWF